MIPRRNLLVAAGFAAVLLIWLLVRQEYEAVVLFFVGAGLFVFFLQRARRRP